MAVVGTRRRAYPPTASPQRTTSPHVTITVTITITESIRAVVGEIDHHTGEQLRQALDLSDAARPRIVIDMRQVTHGLQRHQHPHRRPPGRHRGRPLAPPGQAPPDQ
ncbi:hypothetical protein AB0D62_38040 [Streptomyces massasporeus]|uniref:hypothetical protein n=1 Tax=Streptomyces massasporeus TaxID=67324 RepID=UPI0033CD7139